MPQRGVCPEDALRRDAVSRLAHVHSYCAAEEVLDLVGVGVRGYPARASDGHATQDEGGEVEERDAGEVRGEEAYDILLEADEDDPRNCTLELRFGGRGFIEAFVHLRVGLVGFRVRASVASTAAGRFLRGSGPLLHMGVLRWHGAPLRAMSNVNRPYANPVWDELFGLTHKEDDFACTDQCVLLFLTSFRTGKRRAENNGRRCFGMAVRWNGEYTENVTANGSAQM